MIKENSKIRGLPQLKKEIRDFLFSEEGKVCKKDVAKLGISLAILATMLEPQMAHAAHTNSHASHSSHSNAYFSAQKGGHSSSGATHDNAHSNVHSNHSNHSNHGNHSRGGWC
jgi:hypothetical protein